jgi:hypothetical protein
VTSKRLSSNHLAFPSSFFSKEFLLGIDEIQTGQDLVSDLLLCLFGLWDSSCVASADIVVPFLAVVLWAVWQCGILGFSSLTILERGHFVF